MNNNQLVQNIRKLSYNFAKYHYDNYLKENKLGKIPEEQVYTIIDTIFCKDKEKELKKFIRASLKQSCQETYNSFAVENVFNEMFSDRSMIIDRISLEIKSFQK